MTKRLRGIVSLLLVFVLCLGMVPGVSAAEVEIPDTFISLLFHRSAP